MIDVCFRRGSWRFGLVYSSPNCFCISLIFLVMKLEVSPKLPKMYEFYRKAPTETTQRRSSEMHLCSQTRYCFPRSTRR